MDNTAIDPFETASLESLSNLIHILSSILIVSLIIWIVYRAFQFGEKNDIHIDIKFPQITLPKRKKKVLVPKVKSELEQFITFHHTRVARYGSYKKFEKYANQEIDTYFFNEHTRHIEIIKSTDRKEFNAEIKENSRQAVIKIYEKILEKFEIEQERIEAEEEQQTQEFNELQNKDIDIALKVYEKWKAK
ncbi:hypothetical protein RyT2_14270 [Pseudolactococcus yaeyamensis]